MATKKKLLEAAAGNSGGGEALATEDVFNTWVYTGTGAALTITNGIDLAGEGGLTWIKSRNFSASHVLFDTERGGGSYLSTNSGLGNETPFSAPLTFNSDGFTINTTADSWNGTFYNNIYASWTFRKAPRFFDVVTYTGDGAVGQVLNHNLGVIPGCIIVKRTDSTSDWGVYNIASGVSTSVTGLSLNATTAANRTNWDNSSYITDTTFSTAGIYDDGGNKLNSSGASYIAYLFAHDPLGPSEDGSDGLIACGTFTTSAGSEFEVDLGWEPSFVLTKRTDSTGNWDMLDTMRGFPVTTNGATALRANLSTAESTLGSVGVTATGFKTYDALTYPANATYIYIAIRRGPMRTPESGTEVFSVKNYAATNTSAEVTHDVTFDTEINANRDVTVTKFLIRDILRDIDGKSLVTSSSSLETAAYPTYWSRKDQRTMYAPSAFDDWWASTSASVNNHISYGLVRAPGFFDQVAYSGNGSAGRAVTHNLGVTPELIWVKCRSSTGTEFVVWHSDLAGSGWLKLNATDAIITSGIEFRFGNNSTYVAPTSEDFTVGTLTTVNASGQTYIANMFATVPGVSKVGSYTGNGTSQTIDCGFTSGARFILIKRTDSTGDWYVWDSVRGIVAGNDPHLSLNITVAEVTTDDSIDPDSSGFIVNQVAATNVNVSSASYIYLAIA